MRARTCVCVLAAAVGLVGCQTFGFDGGATTTGPSTHTCIFTPCMEILVSVDESTNPPTIKVNYDIMKMYTRNQGATVTWTLLSPKYEFRHSSVDFYDPIIFKSDNAGSAPSQFINWDVKPNTVTMTNLNTNALKYTYKLRVYRKTTGSSPSPLPPPIPPVPPYYETDPIIVNDY